MAPSAVDAEQVNGHSESVPVTKANYAVSNESSTQAAQSECANFFDSMQQTATAEDFEYPPLATPYRILNQYHSKPTKLRVASIGAGASGLCLIYKMVIDFER